jgi:tRNA nucleotidyltransferase (CCA-adding enzyme)
MDWFLERARALGVEHQAPPPIVLGRHLMDLGVRPGPDMGKLLKIIYERQLDGAFATLEDGIEIAKQAVAGQPGRQPEPRSAPDV